MKFLTAFLLCLLSAIFCVQICTVNFYAAYSAYKSFNEYFCIQERPTSTYDTYNIGEVTSISFIDPSFIHEGKEYRSNIYDNNNVLIELQYDDRGDGFTSQFDLYWPSKNTGGIEKLWIKNKLSLQTFNGVKIDITNLGMSLKMEYKIEDSYFNFVCSSSNGFAEHPVDWVDDGYFKVSTGWYSPRNVTGSNINCSLEKRLKDCTLKVSHTEAFFKVYFTLSVILIILILSTIVPFQNHLTLRYFSKIKDIMSKRLIWGDFCNPITKRSVKFNVGDKFCEISDEAYSEFDNLPWSDDFTDQDGRYQIFLDEISVTSGESCEILHLTERSKTVIGKYFSLCKFNYKYCALLNKKHFLKTREVINLLIKGKGFKVSVAPFEFIANDVYESDVQALTKTFKILKGEAIILLEHNKRFFKRMEMSCLNLCLNNKTGGFYKPENVNNSTWKLYGSDFHHLMENLKSKNTFRQVKWPPSKTLRELFEYIDLNRVKTINDLEVETVIKPSDLNKFKVEFNLPDKIKTPITDLLNKLGDSISSRESVTYGPGCEPLKKVQNCFHERLMVMNSKIKNTSLNRSFVSVLKENLVDLVKDVEGIAKNNYNLLNGFCNTATKDEIYENRGTDKEHFGGLIKKVIKPRKNKMEISKFKAFKNGEHNDKNSYYYKRGFDQYDKLDEKDKEFLINNKVKYVVAGGIYDFNNFKKRLNNIKDKFKCLKSTTVELYNYFDSLQGLEEDDQEGNDEKIEVIINVEDIYNKVLKKNNMVFKAKKSSSKSKRKSKGDGDNKKKISKNHTGLQCRSYLKDVPLSYQLKIASEMLKHGFDKISELNDKNDNIETKLVKPRAIHNIKGFLIKKVFKSETVKEYFFNKINEEKLKNVKDTSSKGKSIELVNEGGIIGVDCPYIDKVLELKMVIDSDMFNFYENLEDL